MATTARSTTAALDPAQVVRWRQDWDAVMAGFVPGMAGLEDAICRAAEAVRGGPPSRVLDLGGGPGVLAERMASRWPDATVALMDIDPVLLALARASLPHTVAVHDGDLCSSQWAAQAGRHDLITVVMTVHYLQPEQARTFYADARRALAPGGLLVVADLMPDDGIPSVMQAMNPAAGEAAAELAWAQWWSDVAGADELAPAVRARTDVFRNRAPAEFTAGAAWHAAAAHDSGFAEAGVLWRCGRHAALVAVAGG